MPRVSGGIPAYRLHKPSGCALVQIKGRRIYLGRYGTADSKARYSQLIAGLAVDTEKIIMAPRPAQDHVGLTVAELCAAYLEWAQRYFQDVPSSMDRVRAVLKLLKDRFARMPVKTFGPLALKSVQEALAAQKKSRRYCNHLTAGIKRVFSWGVSEELVPPHVHQGLMTVRGLRRGRTAAKERPPVKAVDDAVVEETLEHLPQHLADLVQLQRLTGARSGEIVLLRPADIDRTTDPWVFIPQHHKTAYAGKERKIFIGPRAQSILSRYLFREPGKYCFCPADYVKELHQERRKLRKSKMPPSQRGRRRKHKPQRAPGQRYETHSYYYAIRRAIEVANRQRAKKKLPAIPYWTPHQLRHAAGTEFRRVGGLDVAQTALGHSHARITEVYAERDEARAIEIVKKIG
jgi:integrase